MVRVGGVFPAAERIAIAEMTRSILQAAAKRLALAENARCRAVRQQQAAANDKSRPSHLSTLAFLAAEACCESGVLTRYWSI
jgi:hypothetical protein